MKKTNKILKTQLLILIIALILTMIITEKFYEQSRSIIKLVKQNVFHKEIIDEYIIPEDGIPIIDYGVIQGIAIGKQSVPISVCQTGLEHYESFINGNIDSYDKFINCADWLLINGVRRDSMIILTYNFPFPLYDMTSPWRSAMAQGQALQLLLRAHKETDNYNYLTFADSLIVPLFLEVNEGGFTHKMDFTHKMGFTNKMQENSWWYEEYADDHTGKIMVLNGMMFTLLGLDEYYEYTKSSKALELFENGINGLVNELSKFDRNGHSYYDILKHPAGGRYHSIHIDQLMQLYLITGEEVLNKYHLKWQKFENYSRIVQLLTAPPKMLIGAYLLNFLIIFFLLEFFIILRAILALFR